MNLNKLLTAKNLTSTLVFIFFFFIGTLVFKDYGIHQDEVLQKKIGFVNLKYVLNVFSPSTLEKFDYLKTEEDLMEFQDKDYGPAYEMVTLVLEQALGLDSYSYKATNLRKFLVFLIYFIGAFFLYKLIDKRTASWKLAILAVILLLLSPRQFVHAFYNSKDILFLTTVIASFYFIYKLYHKPVLLFGIIGGALAGFATSGRIIGVMIPALLFGNLVYEFIISNEKKGFFKSKMLFSYIGFFIAFLLGLYVSIPYLWSDPIGHFVDIIANMSKFRWPYTVLFNGDIINATELPSSYLPMWIMITVPLLYLVLFIVGVVLLVMQLVKLKSFKPVDARFDLTVLAIFILPLAYFIMSKPVLYDGWKHMYFMYFVILYFAILTIKAFVEVQNKNIVRYAFFGILAVNSIYLAIFMIRSHPYQNIYYNRLMPHAYINKNFVHDYSAITYKQGLDFVASQVADGDSAVVMCMDIFGPDKTNQNYHAIKDEYQERLRFVDDFNEADYYIVDYRRHTEDYPYTNEVFTAQVGKIRFLSVFELGENEPVDTINMYYRIYNHAIYEDIYSPLQPFKEFWGKLSGETFETDTILEVSVEAFAE